MAGSDLTMSTARPRDRSCPTSSQPSTNDLRALIYAIGRPIPAAATPPGETALGMSERRQ